MNDTPHDTNTGVNPPETDAASTQPTSEAVAASDDAPQESDDKQQLRQKIVEAMQTVYDPEIPVNIYDLGLIYAVDISPSNHVTVTMTLTTPNCPEAQSLPENVRASVQYLPEVHGCEVNIVWEPAWNPGMMSEDAKVMLNMF